MLGISGSGKTSFLSGVYQTMMMNSFHGLTLVSAVNTDQAYQQMGQIADIALINREDYAFALGTQETTIFPLTLENDGKEICDFDFTDYRGGDVADILNAGGSMSASASMLKAQLINSDAILIFADASVLARGSKVVEWQKASGATRIGPLLNMLIREMGDKPLTVLLVLTKTDDENIPEELKANHYVRLVERAMQAFDLVYQIVHSHQEDGWSFGVIPVSAVGEGNSTTIQKDVDGQIVFQSKVKEGCVPEPYNIDVAMIYTIACILSQWSLNMNAEKTELMNRFIAAGRENTWMANTASRLRNLFANQKTESPGDVVAERLKALEEKEKDIAQLENHISSLMKKTKAGSVIQRRRDHLDI
jgi:GTPase SAR1 family protein